MFVLLFIAYKIGNSEVTVYQFVVCYFTAHEHSPVRSKRIMGRAHRNTANPAWMVPRYEGNEAEVLFEAHVELCGGHADPGAAAGGRYHLHDLCDPDAPYDAGQ